MSDYRRACIKGGTFFFTVVAYLRRPIFASESAIQLLEQSFSFAIDKRPFVVDALVILPDHLHCIWTLPDDDFDFSTRWRLVKTFFSKRFEGGRTITPSMIEKKEKGIWQRRFWEHTIWDDEDYRRHCDYIHYNPVKHGLVDSPAAWGHSTFKSFVEQGIHPPEWGQSIGKEVLKLNLE